MPEGTIPDLPPLEGDSIRLRPWAHADTPAVVEAGGDEFIPVITSVPADADEAAAHDFVDRQIGRPETDWGHARAIADRTTDRAIGHLYASLIHHRLGRVEMGYWVLPSHRGRGIAGEALSLASEWALTNWPINRVTLYIEPWNVGSIRTAERAGFQAEGTLHDWEAYDDGVARDMRVFARLARDVPPADRETS
ncbi:MAG: GNAT family protein [Actinomycetota bacterium]